MTFVKIIQLFAESRGRGQRRTHVVFVFLNYNTCQHKTSTGVFGGSKMPHQACVSSVLVEVVMCVLLFCDYLVSGFVVLQQDHFSASTRIIRLQNRCCRSVVMDAVESRSTRHLQDLWCKNMFDSSLAKVAALTSGYSDFLSAQEVVMCSSSLFGLSVRRGKINPERCQPVRTSCEDPKECCTTVVFSDLLAFGTWCK